MNPTSIPRASVPALLLGALVCAAASSLALEQSAEIPDSTSTLSTDAMVETADSLFATRPAVALELLEEALADGGEDSYELRWRAARSALVLGVLEEDEDRELQWFERANRHSDAALARDEAGLDGLYWSAVSKGRLALQHGPRTTARLTQEVWDLTHRILELDPRHPGAHNILGKLNQEVMSLSGWKRFLGRLVLRTEPLRESSWAKALRHHRQAVESDSTTVLFRMDLGRTLQKSGSPGEARGVYEAALDLPDRYPVDEKFKRQIREYLAELGPSGDSSD